MTPDRSQQRPPEFTPARLRASAELLVRNMLLPENAVQQAAMDLAIYTLATVNDDDDELVTGYQHALDCGMERHMGTLPGLYLACGPENVLTWNRITDQWHLSGGTRLFRSPPTKGQLRKLFSVLGIEPKENPHAT